MKTLKRFNKNEKALKKVIIVLSICLVVSIAISSAMSFAFYQKVDELPFVNARVGEFKTNDIQLTMLLDGNEVETPPSKDNYVVTVDCDNADGSWDMTEWLAKIGNISAGKVKCEVNFATPEPILSEVTAKPYTTSIELTYTAAGTNTVATCKYGTEEGNYENVVEGATNSNCSITELEKGVMYYYQVCAVNGGGEVCKTGSTKTYPLSEQVKVGDYISMTPTSTSYTISKDLTGYSEDQTINPSELNLWRVIKKNDDGTIEMVSDKVSSTNIYLGGSIGYLNSVLVLNSIAEQYTDEVHVLKTRHMGFSNQTLKCSGPIKYKDPGDCDSDGGYETDAQLVRIAYGGSGTCAHACPELTARDPISSYDRSYWLPARYFHSENHYSVMHVIGGGTSGAISNVHLVRFSADGTYEEFSIGMRVRPVIVLKSDNKISAGSGDSLEPFELV